MTRLTRSTAVTLIAALGLLLAACAPSSGSLGTPATPPATAVPSAEPSASDAVPSTAPPAMPSTAPPAIPSAATAMPSEGTATTVPGSPTVTASPTASPTPTPAPTGTMIVRAYLMLGSFTDNPGLVPVLRTVPETKAVAKAAIEALLAGPSDAEMSVSPAMYTGIPEGTRLLDVSIAAGVATVNLSSEFKNAAAGSQADTAAAQVVYTATQFSTVDRVRIEVDGVTTVSAAGRADYRASLPAIFVDRPAWGAAAGNPAPIGGLANVFEATFRAQLLDARGSVLADQQVMASCGTGCWGRFSSSLAYAVSKGQYGTLRVFDLSAKDGTPENVTEYRVWLTPAG